MIVPSSKTLTEQYWDMVNQSSSNGLMPVSNGSAVQAELPDKHLTAGAPSVVCPPDLIRDAIYYHDLGLMGKLTHKITTWLRKQAD